MLRDRALIPLSQQHQNGLALCVLTDRGLTGNASTEGLARLASRVVDRYDNELANHFAIEEEVLFPVIERELGPCAIVHELIAEHRQLEKLVEQLRAGADLETLQQFSTLLRTHIRREENELFEDIQGRLPRETLDALGAAVDARAVRIRI
jgi:hemerythrin-like domain-containing protein